MRQLPPQSEPTFGFTDSPFGECCIVSSTEGICALTFPEDRESALYDIEQRFPETNFTQNDAKAKRFGQEALPWWNLFAPVGKTSTVYSFPEARDFVLTHFGEFSPELSDFARRAFDHHWLDCEMRDGKRGGGSAWKYQVWVNRAS